MPDLAWFTYIVRCSDGSLYTGVTNDLRKRLQTHNSGQGAKYTAGRQPVVLVYHEKFEAEASESSVSAKSAAMRREYQIKQLTREEKEKLIGAD